MKNMDSKSQAARPPAGRLREGSFLLPDFPVLRWPWIGVVAIRIRILGLENSKSEMKNMGSKSRAALPLAGRHAFCREADSPAGRLRGRWSWKLE
ncbi:hypothetical protein Tco_0270972 [Tanacetum coccineum]